MAKRFQSQSQKTSRLSHPCDPTAGLARAQYGGACRVRAKELRRFLSLEMCDGPWGWAGLNTGECRRLMSCPALPGLIQRNRAHPRGRESLRRPGLVRIACTIPCSCWDRPCMGLVEHRSGPVSPWAGSTKPLKKEARQMASALPCPEDRPLWGADLALLCDPEPGTSLPPCFIVS